MFEKKIINVSSIISERIRGFETETEKMCIQRPLFDSLFKKCK